MTLAVKNGFQLVVRSARPIRDTLALRLLVFNANRLTIEINKEISRLSIERTGIVRDCCTERLEQIRMQTAGNNGKNMRQITVTAPQGSVSEVGISEVTVVEKRVLQASGSVTTKDSIEMDVGTATAKAFLDEFTSQPFFSREKFSVAVRQPRGLE
jgi:hypothetical protein